MTREWISIKKETPFDECDILLTDGSILVDCIYQSDGDFYWRNWQQGEIFIREEAVTHWSKKSIRQDEKLCPDNQ